MQGFFFEYSGLLVVNYVSIVLAVIVYVLVMSKFVRASRVVDEIAVA